MVFTLRKNVYMPTSTPSSLRPNAIHHIRGKGMGSVLLKTGGAGAGSSYSSIDDYVATTGRPLPSGGGLGASLSKKLEELKIKPHGKKAKNIKFEL
jgi:hypothetical protein